MPLPTVSQMVGRGWGREGENRTPSATPVPTPVSTNSFMDALQKIIIHTNERAPNRHGDGYNPLLPPVKCTSKVNKEPPCCLLKGCALMCITVLRLTSSIALSIYSWDKQV